MAKVKASIDSSFKKKPKKKGVVSKNKTSSQKSSKLYKKPYKGQGR